MSFFPNSQLLVLLASGPAFLCMQLHTARQDRTPGYQRCLTRTSTINVYGLLLPILALFRSYTTNTGWPFKSAIVPSLCSWKRTQVTSPSCRHERFKPSSGQHHHYDPPARIRRDIPCIRDVTYSALSQTAASASQRPSVVSQL